jgi:hypothetical protein
MQHSGRSEVGGHAFGEPGYRRLARDRCALGEGSIDRIVAYDRGEIAAFPIDEVFSLLRDRLKR